MALEQTKVALKKIFTTNVLSFYFRIELKNVWKVGK